MSINSLYQLFSKGHNTLNLMLANCLNSGIHFNYFAQFMDKQFKCFFFNG